MNVKGRRIHIAGSADTATEPTLLAYAHSLIAEMTTRLAQGGARFLVDFGREPKSGSDASGRAVVFYWTVVETVNAALVGGTAQYMSTQGPILLCLATSKTDAQIPDDRRGLYSGLRTSGAISMEFSPAGWASGAVRRQRQAQLGDILILISGGEGVEHLAREYTRKGKPVIPLDLQLGSSTRDGTGGASKLFSQALRDPALFFSVEKNFSAPELLERTATRQGRTPINEVVSNVLGLLTAIVPPRAFYVRMLNRSLPDFAEVESFFRTIVDPVVREFAFEPLEIGLGDNDYAWMNQAIFEGLHHSQVAFVDLTGLRANCFIELGYALGNGQHVMVSAKDGTTLPFDSSQIETFLWDLSREPKDLQEELKTYWRRNFNKPPIVIPRGLR
jgi:hypothetical protein